MNEVQEFILRRAMQKVASKGLDKEAASWLSKINPFNWGEDEGEEGYQKMTPEQRRQKELELYELQGKGTALRGGLNLMDTVLAPVDAVKWGVDKVKNSVKKSNDAASGLAQGLLPTAYENGRAKGRGFIQGAKDIGKTLYDSWPRSR